MANRHFKKQSGFSLLEQVSAISLFAITSASAAHYMQDWVDVSEQQVLNYSQAAAHSAMAIHQQWQQAKGQPMDKSWQQVIDINGVEHTITANNLTMVSLSKKHCRQLSLTGQEIIASDC